MPLTGPRPDAEQVLQNIYDPATNTIQVEIPSTSPIPVTVPVGQPLPVQVTNAIIPEEYDALALTYYSSGNGAGQVQTVTYYTGGQSGTVQAVLTLTYNSAGQVATVTRT